MTPLEAADVLAIAERVIGDDVAGADLEALADLPSEPADLLYRLVTRPAFTRHNQAIAVLALLEMLQRNGCDADLDPPDELAALLTTPDLTTLSRWLEPRINKEQEMFERFTHSPRSPPASSATTTSVPSTSSSGLPASARVSVLRCWPIWA